MIHGRCREDDLVAIMACFLLLSSVHLAIERARQGAFLSHPKGKAVPALPVVETLDRGQPPLFALLLAQHPARPCHGLAGSGSGS